MTNLEIAEAPTEQQSAGALPGDDARENGVAALMFCIRELMKAAASRWQAQGDAASFLMASPLDSLLRRSSSELLLRRTAPDKLSLIAGAVHKSRWTRRRLLFVCDTDGSWCWQGSHVDVIVVVVESILAMEPALSAAPGLLPPSPPTPTPSA